MVWYFSMAFLVHLSSSNIAIMTDCSSSTFDCTRMTNVDLWADLRTADSAAIDGAIASRFIAMSTALAACSLRYRFCRACGHEVMTFRPRVYY